MALAPQPIRYRPVPGTGTNMMARVKLYVGPDHLLQVTSNGFTETYRRFFFHDIQVISLHKTVVGLIGNLIWAGLLLLFTFIAAAVQAEGNSGGSIAWWAVAGLLAGILGWNLRAGPTCACYIQTAVQQQRLHSIRRVKRARRLIEQLKPMLAAVQGSAPGPPVAPVAPPAEPSDRGSPF